MKAIIKSLKLNQYEAKKGDNKGKKFKKFDFVAQVTTDESKGYVKDIKGSFSEDYGRRYFKFCGFKTVSEVIGKPCEVTTQKRRWSDSDGNERTVNEVRYLHLLDENGRPIYLKEDNDDDNVAF